MQLSKIIGGSSGAHHASFLWPAEFMASVCKYHGAGLRKSLRGVAKLMWFFA
jgi:hypothetical protein